VDIVNSHFTPEPMRRRDANRAPRRRQDLSSAEHRMARLDMPCPRGPIPRTHVSKPSSLRELPCDASPRTLDADIAAPSATDTNGGFISFPTKSQPEILLPNPKHGRAALNRPTTSDWASRMMRSM
jgi:hypothetical protein